ncbi:hypothetical protein NDU88_006172, partial [Pleurodeles waltl]
VVVSSFGQWQPVALGLWTYESTPPFLALSPGCASDAVPSTCDITVCCRGNDLTSGPMNSKRPKPSCHPNVRALREADRIWATVVPATFVASRKLSLGFPCNLPFVSYHVMV